MRLEPLRLYLKGSCVAQLVVRWPLCFLFFSIWVLLQRLYDSKIREFEEVSLRYTCLILGVEIKILKCFCGRFFTVFQFHQRNANLKL